MGSALLFADGQKNLDICPTVAGSDGKMVNGCTEKDQVKQGFPIKGKEGFSDFFFYSLFHFLITV